MTLRQLYVDVMEAIDRVDAERVDAAFARYEGRESLSFAEIDDRLLRDAAIRKCAATLETSVPPRQCGRPAKGERTMVGYGPRHVSAPACGIHMRHQPPYLWENDDE